MLPSELYFKILHLLKPSLNYFLVSKLFNILCNEVYFEDKKYLTEKILVRFQINDSIDQEEYDIRIFGQAYKFISHNEYRMYKNFKLRICAVEDCDHLFYCKGSSELIMTKIEDEKVIKFAKEKIYYLNCMEINLDNIIFHTNIKNIPDKEFDIINDRLFYDYILRKYQKTNDKEFYKILPFNFLKYLTFDFVELKSKITIYQITDEAKRIAKENECFENLKMFREKLNKEKIKISVNYLRSYKKDI